MAIVLAEVMRILEAIAPPALAEDWDNVGLQVGDPARPIAAVWVALDPGPEVIAAAVRRGVDLLIVHHPLIFRPLARVDGQTPIGAALLQAAANGLAVYAMHTNLDSAAGGLNDQLARRLGLQRVKALAAAGGKGGRGSAPALGRVGTLAGRRLLRELAIEVKGRLGLDAVRVVGDPELPVRRVAVSTGSGGSLLSHFLGSAAEVFITGDLRYHDARALEDARRGAIDIGHFNSEHFMTGAVAERLGRIFRRRRLPIRVEACPHEQDPFRLY